MDPLAWFPSDRFSFPSGHALNAFAIGSVVALAFPLAAVPVLAVAASVAASRVVVGLVIVQARTASSRLLGKVLLPVAGAPVLGRMIEHVLAARTRFELVVATTGRPEDEEAGPAGVPARRHPRAPR